MTRRKTIPTAARVAAVVRLCELKPRTSFASCAGIVDGAAVLVEDGQPPEVVRAIFSVFRLDDAEVGELLALLEPGSAPSRPATATEFDAAVGQTLDQATASGDLPERFRLVTGPDGTVEEVEEVPES